MEEFVPARDALVKELRRSGDREAVEAVKRLRKPSLAAWALNQAARRHADEVGRLLEVGAALREAQHEALAGDAGHLRGAGRELGQAVERVADLAAAELAGAGREASNAQRERILATLRAAARRRARRRPEGWRRRKRRPPRAETNRRTQAGGR